jgi:hypothetical protein
VKCNSELTIGSDENTSLSLLGLSVTSIVPNKRLIKSLGQMSGTFSASQTLIFVENKERSFFP